MNKIKKTLGVLVALTMLATALPATAIYAANDAVVTSANKEVTKLNQISGTVVSIDGNKVTIKLSDDSTAVLDLSIATYVEDIKVGSEVIGLTNPNAPMTMIYPPQYRVTAVVENTKGFVIADKFNEQMINSDNTLKLNVSEFTTVVDENGNKYVGSIKDKLIIVHYGASTKSIPAMTTPTKIVVLSENLAQDTETPNTAVSPLDSITGVITEKTADKISIKGNEGQIINVLYNNNTKLDDKLQVGEAVVAFYSIALKTDKSYPAEHTAIAVVRTESKANLEQISGILIEKTEELMVVVDKEGQRNRVTYDHVAYLDAKLQTGEKVTVFYNPETKTDKSYPLEYYAQAVIRTPQTVPEIQIQPMEQATLSQITGIITEKTDELIVIKGEEGQITNISYDRNSYIDEKLQVGEKVTVFYDIHSKTDKSYPSKYVAEAIVRTPETGFVVGDYFNSELINSDGTLKLNVSENTEVILENGHRFGGSLKNRTMIVFYSTSTKSIPAITVPERIIVLFEKIQPVTENRKAEVVIDEGKTVKNQAEIKDGTVLVPLREVANALGIEIAWDQERQVIRVGTAIELKLGVNSYTIGRRMPVELEAAPTLIDGITYVPVSFFNNFLQTETEVTTR